MNKVKLFLKSIASSAITISIFFLVWLVNKPLFSFMTVLKFIAPYYMLWIIIMCMSIKHHGKSFRIIWKGSMRYDDTWSKANMPYAAAFLLGSIAIFIGQYYFFR
jgi:hypothetical protein